LGSRSDAGETIHAGGAASTFGASSPPLTSSFRANGVTIERGRGKGTSTMIGCGRAIAGKNRKQGRWRHVNKANRGNAKGARSREERREAGVADAKWRGKGFTPPAIYRCRRATLLRTACVTRNNCRRHRLPLTDGPHNATTAGCARTRGYYGAATEGPRRPITSAPTTSTTLAAAPPGKARPPHDRCRDCGHLMARFLTE
jgi:hypothetical protein